MALYSQHRKLFHFQIQVNLHDLSFECKEKWLLEDMMFYKTGLKKVNLYMNLCVKRLMIE